MQNKNADTKYGIFASAKVPFLFLFLIISLFLAVAKAAPASSAVSATSFSFHLSNEPSSLDPHRQKSSASSYLLQNLYRNLFTYDNDRGLLPDLGESCKREGALVLVCKLKKGLTWSDGSALTSADFLKAYQRILDPKESAPRADMLFKIKNAPAVFKGQKKPENLGITAPNPLTLRFEFEEKDPDFEYNLASFLTAPVKNTLRSDQNASELVVSGPYRISEWQSGQKIRLINNPQYAFGNFKSRPQVDVFFINEDSVSLQLYEKNQLSFLRRLPTLYIPKFKSRADFHWVPVIRFDYIGFGPSLKDEPLLREAFTLSLNYPDLQKIFSAEGLPPGCPGLPRKWLTEDLCYKFNKDAARKQLAKATSDGKKIPTDLRLLYSTLGGEDHRRATEWMQSQWDKNLGVKVQMVVRENKVYQTEMQTSPPPLFRKGVAPDRPTCLATLETFADWNSENYIQLKDPEFQDLLKKLSEASKPADQKKLCTEGVRYLVERKLLIPLGSIHFAILAKRNFIGWKLNAMNQLDLAGLELKN